MGLFSHLVETYDKCSSASGLIPVDGEGKPQVRKVLIPIFFDIVNMELCVVLDRQGRLVDATRSKSTPTLLPCTEKSTSRSGFAIAPHGLYDKLGYIDKCMALRKYRAYIQQLSEWKGDNEKLNAIYKYLTENSIVKDLDERGLFVDSERNEDGSLNETAVATLGAKFFVEIPNDLCPDVALDKKVQDLWTRYQLKGGDVGFDYITGEELTQLARTHPKSIIPAKARAGLISGNDSRGFTYRGRFTNTEEAVNIDAISSGKAHACLKWLVGNSGINVADQVFLIWAVSENACEPITPFEDSYSIAGVFDNMKADKTERDIINEALSMVDNNYSQKVKNALFGQGKASKIKEHNNKIVIAALDSATPGRLGVTFYRELDRDEYLENIAKWHENTSWMLKVIDEGGKAKENGGAKKSKKEQTRILNYIGCPSFYDMLEAMHGKPKSMKDDNYAKLKKRVCRTLLECVIGNGLLPLNYINTAARRVSQPLIFTDNEGKFKEHIWQSALSITCAMIKNKYREVSMELDEKRLDRDYLYGRLLAVVNMIEKRAMDLADKGYSRPTNALKLMNSFAIRPLKTYGVLRERLVPYVMLLTKNNDRHLGYYEKLINDIMTSFLDGDYENNKPLSPLYLLGYSAQEKEFYKKNNKDNKEKEGEEKNESNNQEN